MNPYHTSRPDSSGFVTLPHHRLYYEIRGAQHQQKLVMLSPLALRLKFHEQFADRIAEKHQVLLIDHRGVGKSTMPAKRSFSRYGFPLLCQQNSKIMLMSRVRAARWPA